MCRQRLGHRTGVGFDLGGRPQARLTQMSDGTLGPPLALRILFEQFHEESRG
jgi:hypothetical protein